jgi:hypothetical protein
MKYILSIIFILFITLPLAAQFKPGDIGFQNNEFELYKKNKVKAAHITNVDMDGYTNPAQTNYYDKQGKLIQVVYNHDTILPQEARNEEMNDMFYYDEDDRITGLVLHGYDLYDITIGFEYKKGKLIAGRIAGAESREYTYTHDKKNNVIERIEKTPTMEMDAEGNATDKAIYTETGKQLYTWNDNNLLAQEVNYMNGEFFFQIKYEYNDNNQLTGYAAYFEQSEVAYPMFRVAFEYDSNGLPSKMITTEMGFTSTSYYSYTFY